METKNPMTQRTVNLDSIFPKEIMERVEWFESYRDDELYFVHKELKILLTHKIITNSYLAQDCEIRAYKRGEKNKEELDRVRISLSLQINLVEGEADGDE